MATPQTIIQRAREQTQMMACFPVLPDDLLARVLDRTDPICPFHSHIGNDAAVQIAMDLAEASFDDVRDVGRGAGRGTQEVVGCARENPIRLRLHGRPSVGKTTFARALAALVGTDWTITDKPVGPNDAPWRMPFAEVDGTSVRKRQEVFSIIESACRAKQLPLLPVRTVAGVRYYDVPPMTLFIDEIHAVPKDLMEGFLKMTEGNEGSTLDIGTNIRVSCKRVAIILGTTNPGALISALLTRFPIAVELKPHNLDQVALMIQNEYHWPKPEAIRLAEMKPVPREAMAIAKVIEQTRAVKGLSLHAAIDRWAENLGLREDGLTDKAVECLVSLAEAQPTGLSKENLCSSLEVAKEEFQKQILPLLLRTASHSAYVTVSGRHKITPEGLHALRLRGYTDY